MRALNRKLVRNLLQMRGQALAIVAVMACGVATFVMSLSTYESLQRMQAGYYQAYRFADVFTSLTRAPEAVGERVAALPGVRRIQTRTVIDATMDVPLQAEPGVARLISVPADRQPALNALHLREGRWIRPKAGDEVLANEGFMDAHGFRPGAQVEAVVNGRLRTLTIVGTVLSPEYVIQVREGDLLPDPERFGVFWMNERHLQAMTDMEGAFNNVTLALDPGASEPDVLHRLDLLLERYGEVGAYGRADHLPHRYLTDDIEGLRAMAVVIPVIFLGVAAFLLNAVVSRMIQSQREQIAALRAFGYARHQIGWHYLKLVLVIALLALAVGTAAGAWMGKAMTGMYTGEFYRFPVSDYMLSPVLVLWAAVVSLGAASGGVLNAVQRAMRLPPAEAMRPEPPATFRPTVLERMGLQRLLPHAARMVLRELERRPLRAALSCLGIAAALAVVVLGRFTADAVEYLNQHQFELVQRQEVQVSFTEARAGRAIYELRSYPGVQHVEGYRLVPMRITSAHRSRQLGVTGLESDPALFRLLDDRERVVTLPPEGLLLSAKLAELLEVTPGDTVSVDVREGRRPHAELVVAGTVADYIGLNAYMQRDALNRLMHEDRQVSGAYLKVDQCELDRLYNELHQTPHVAGVLVRDAMYENFQRTMVETQRPVLMFNITFAILIAFGVVYNTARISLAERGREMATLRVLGFTRGEISAILLGELAVLTFMAIPVGVLLGTGFAWVVTVAFETEMYRIPLVISRWTFGFSIAVVLVAALGSGLVVRRRIDRLDLIGVLKARE